MTYSTILFDFDGTLTDSLPLWLESYRQALLQHGVSISEAEIVSTCFYRPWGDVAATYNLPSAARFGELVHEELHKLFGSAELFDGVIESIAHLSNNGAKLGIVTSSMRSIVMDFLERHNLLQCFQSLVTADDITNFKPHPEPVLKALHELSAEPRESLMVGDSPVDIIASRAAGLEPCLFFPADHEQFYKYSDPRSHQPRLIFDSYSQFIPLVEKGLSSGQCRQDEQKS